MERVVFPRNPNYEKHPCFTPCHECRANGQCSLQRAHAAQQRKVNYITPEIAQRANEEYIEQLRRWELIRQGLRRISANLQEFHDLYKKAKFFTNNFTIPENVERVKVFFESKYKPKFNPDEYFIQTTGKDEV